MKILVTGGSGFIGHYVVENLKNLGYNPIIFDRYQRKNTDIFLGDVRDLTAVYEAVAISDGVIHLAGVLGTAESIEEPLPSIETNILGSLNIFRACRRYNTKCVYISVGNYWMNNSYSITKDAAERFALMFNKELKTKIAIVRGLNAYGPLQKIAPIRKIIPNFVIPALKNEELLIYGNGSQVMDMIYVNDIADILVKALLVEHSFPKFDAGTGRPTTVQEIAELVISLIGTGRIINIPMRAGELENSTVLGDPETLRPLYSGNIPSLTPLEKGLIPTIKYYKDKLQSEYS